jgi:uracil-DNA glycosylase
MNFDEQFGTLYLVLKEFLESKAFVTISKQIRNDRYDQPIFPPVGSELFFKVFRETNYNRLKVITLGQYPYYGENEYDGLAFSNSMLEDPLPVLKDILNEVEKDVYNGLALNRVTDYSLFNWAEQGVLLLNIDLSVRIGQPNSHIDIWKPFMKFLIKKLNEKNDLIWILWDKKSQSYANLITNPSHYKIYNLSKCFSKCNEQLKVKNKKEITW